MLCWDRVGFREAFYFDEVHFLVSCFYHEDFQHSLKRLYLVISTQEILQALSDYFFASDADLVIIKDLKSRSNLSYVLNYLLD